MRFVLKEEPPTAAEKKALAGDRDVQISYGAVLGALTAVKDSRTAFKRTAQASALEEWYLNEEDTRSKGNIFFVHTKYLLIDPLSDDRLICTGYANFKTRRLFNIASPCWIGGAGKRPNDEPVRLKKKKTGAKTAGTNTGKAKAAKGKAAKNKTARAKKSPRPREPRLRERRRRRPELREPSRE